MRSSATFSIRFLGNVAVARVVVLALFMITVGVSTGSLSKRAVGVGLSDINPPFPAVHPGVIDCHGGTWTSGNLTLGSNGCQALFSLMYALTQHFDQNFSSEQYNFSFAIPWVAEIAPNGSLVRLASPLDPLSDVTTVTSGPLGVNVSVVEVANVTSASGNWTPDSTWAGSGPQWNTSGGTIGTTDVSVVFHLSNASGGSVANLSGNDSYTLKFDFGVDGWPWASQSDRLGFGIDSLAAGGAHFSYNLTTKAIDEEWNSTGKTYASLLFGSNASVRATSALPRTISVTQQVGLFYAASADRRAVVLLTFETGMGNYTNLSYDPWVVFTTNGPFAQAIRPPLGYPPLTAVSVAVIASVAAVSATVGLCWNGRRLHAEGEDLIASMKRTAAEDGQRSNRHL